MILTAPVLLTVLFSLGVQASDLQFSVIGDYKSWNPQSQRLTSSPFKWTKENVFRLENAREEVNIAYFLQVSESSLPMVYRLLDRLHHSDNVYAVHCDKKIPAYKVVQTMARIKDEPKFKNVYFMERESVTYRGVTMILNNIAAINFLLEKGDWSYIINLSASDYPLVAPDVPRKLLALPHIQEREYNFFTLSPRNQWEERKRNRFNTITVDMTMGMSENDEDSRLVNIGQQNPLKDALNYEYAYSEGWFILSRKASKFMVSSAHGQRILLTMAFSQDPSEHYYVSVFWNHPHYNKTILSHSLRRVFWTHNGVPGGQHPYTIDTTMDDDGNYALWPRLRGSPHWFARKFKNADSKILDWIDSEMSGLGPQPNETSVDEARIRTDMHLQWLCGLLNE